MTDLGELSARLTALIPTRWPYAPEESRIRLVPPDRFTGDWGGRYDFRLRIAFINASLSADVAAGVIAHELAHGRWSAPLPTLLGEQGAAQLALEMFDELRVEYFAIHHTPSVRDEIRAWVAQPATVVVHNRRGAALAYGNIVGRVRTGTYTDDEVADIVDKFRKRMGSPWILTFDAMLAEALAFPPGSVGDLITLARRWDRAAVNSVIFGDEIDDE